MWFPAWHFKSAFFPPSTSVILKWPDRLEFGHTEIYGLQNSPLRKYSLVLDVEGQTNLKSHTIAHHIPCTDPESRCATKLNKRQREEGKQMKLCSCPF